MNGLFSLPFFCIVYFSALQLFFQCCDRFSLLLLFFCIGPMQIRF